MATNTVAVKNLAIALEALSRINHPASGNMFEAVENLLDAEISRARKENNEAYKASTNTSDDDIPF